MHEPIIPRTSYHVGVEKKKLVFYFGASFLKTCHLRETSFASEFFRVDHVINHCYLLRCFKFCYEDVREVHKRRYLLQPSAVEVFSSDGRNLLLSFPRKVRNKVYTRWSIFYLSEFKFFSLRYILTV